MIIQIIDGIKINLWLIIFNIKIVNIVLGQIINRILIPFYKYIYKIKLKRQKLNFIYEQKCVRNTMLN